MKTDDLIKLLAADAELSERFEKSFLWLGPAMLVMAIIVALTLGIRSDLAVAIQEPVSALRFVLGLGLGVAALRAVIVLARPGADLGLRVVPILAIAFFAAALWGLTYLAVPADARAAAIRGETAVVCLITIPVLSVLPVVVLFSMLRKAAPTRPALAGAMAGIAGAGLAAAVYALHCTEDSPLFYVTWYGLGIIIVMTTSSIMGRRLLRW